jgi:hypothetical protein
LAKLSGRKALLDAVAADPATLALVTDVAQPASVDTGADRSYSAVNNSRRSEV